MKDRIDDVEDHLEIGEAVIRGFMVIGVLVWTVAALGALLGGQMLVFYMYGGVALFTVTAFVIGEFYEIAASVLLGIGAAALIVWGAVSAWTLGIWAMMGAMLIAPMMVAAGMFLFEEHEERVIARVEAPTPTHVAHA